MQEDLPLAGDGEHRSPWRGGDGVDRAGPPGDDGRVEQEILRHRRGAVGLERRAVSNLGLDGLRADDDLFSSNPPSIQRLRISICVAASLSPSGGIFGSAVWSTQAISDELASPGSTIFPPELPFRVPEKVERSRPPLVLSGLWQFRQDCSKIGKTCSSKVVFSCAVARVGDEARMMNARFMKGPRPKPRDRYAASTVQLTRNLAIAVDLPRRRAQSPRIGSAPDGGESFYVLSPVPHLDLEKRVFSRLRRIVRDLRAPFFDVDQIKKGEDFSPCGKAGGGFLVVEAFGCGIPPAAF